MQDDSVYLVASGILSGAVAKTAVESGAARWLAGGPLAFTACAVLRRTAEGRQTEMRSVADLQSCRLRDDARLAAAVEARLEDIAAARAPFAGLSMDRPRLMGVVNVTPDSFSDGGRYASRDAAIAHGRALREAGADILDIGGESTRPGAAPVSIQQELDRVLPVVETLAADGALVSIDTRHAAVMGAALAAGARIVNDITALSGDPESLAAAAGGNAAIVLMHMQGEPRTMQQNPVYRDAPLDVFDFFGERLQACEAAGIDRSRIAVDPGIGVDIPESIQRQLLEAGR